MSHPNRWRCQCGADLGTVKRVGQATAIDAPDPSAFRRFMVGTSGLAAICASCGRNVLFEPQPMACTQAS